jgi:hypothetical protein
LPSEHARKNATLSTATYRAERPSTGALSARPHAAAAAQKKRTVGGTPQSLGRQNGERHLNAVEQVPAPVDVRDVRHDQCDQDPSFGHALAREPVRPQKSVERDDGDEERRTEAEGQLGRRRRVEHETRDDVSPHRLMGERSTDSDAIVATAGTESRTSKLHRCHDGNFSRAANRTPE